MPFYEYSAKDKNKSCGKCIDCFEIYASILSDDLKVCPDCGNKVEKLVSLTAGFVTKGKQANQYSDIRCAKYWRDNNGVRHRVTDADGYATSPTVSRRTTASPEQVEARTKKDRKETQDRLSRIRHYYKKKD